MSNFISKLLFIFVLIMLGCGGAGGSLDKNIQIYGHVADGYLEDAIVFLDYNLNQVADKEERQTITSSYGKYEIQTNFIPINNEIELSAYGGIDTMFQRPFNGLLKAQADYTGQSDVQLNLTPLSTLAVAYREVSDDFISIDASIKTVNEYALSQNLLEDPVSKYINEPNDLKQNIKFHCIALALTEFEYNNKEKDNVYKIYKKLALKIKDDKNINNLKTYTTKDNKKVNISKLTKSIIQEVDDIKDPYRQLPYVLKDIVKNPQDYIYNDENDKIKPSPQPPPPNSSNNPPVAENLNINTDKNIPIISNALANDSDGDTLIYELVSDVNNGTLSFNINGSFTYAPILNYTGNDSFTFKAYDSKVYSNIATVNIKVKSINIAPIANDFNISINEDTNISNQQLTATDVDADTLTYIVETNTTNGKLILNSTNGKFNYNPNKNYNGNDTFTYKVNDGFLDSNIATVKIKINPLNDTPTAKDFSIKNIKSYAKTINFIEESNASDVEDNLNLTAHINTTQQASKGIININNSTKELTYTPNPNESGVDTFKLDIKDTNAAFKTITVSVEDIDTIIPSIITPNIPNNFQIDKNLTIKFSKQIDVNTLVGNIILKTGSNNVVFSAELLPDNKTLIIDGDLEYSKNYTLTIQNTKDLSGNVLPNKTFTFSSENFIPTADNFDVSNFGNQISTTINWKNLSNATDINDNLTAILKEAPKFGTVSINGDNLTYTPNPNQETDDSFKLQIQDNSNANTTITIKILSIDNKAPILVSQKPQNDEIDFLVDENLTYDFNEAIKNVNISFTPSLSFTHTINGKTLNIKASNLEKGKTYTLKLTNIKDKVGNTLANQIIKFTTKFNICYVSVGATGSGNSWNDTTDIQNAINLTSGKDDYQIWIKKGIYNINQTITLKNKIKIYGCFNGTEEKRTQRNISINQTILDGGETTRIAQANSAKDIILDSLVFQNGLVNQDGSGGAAINAEHSSIKINNSIFKNNKTKTTSSGYGGAIRGFKSDYSITGTSFIDNQAISQKSYAGAIYMYNTSKLELKDSNFTNNSSNKGGALYAKQNVKSKINNVNFTNNTSSNAGGAIFIGSGSNSNIENTHFIGNSSKKQHGGAINLHYADEASIKKSNFSSNISSNKGGAIRAENTNSLIIEDSNFTKNIAKSSGGAIYAYKIEESLTLKDSNFSSNTSNNGGAMYAHTIESLTLKDSNFTKNIAKSNGGAIYAYNIEESLTLKDSNFTKNIAKSSGGAMYAHTLESLTLKDSNFSSNTSNSNAGAIWAFKIKSLIIKGTNFIKNNCSELGSAIFAAYNKSTSIDRTLFFKNISNNPNTVNDRSVVVMHYLGSTLITNSSFIQNEAGKMAGIDLYDTNITVANCNFIENKSKNDNTYASGLAVRGSSQAEVYNSIFWGNYNTGINKKYSDLDLENSASLTVKNSIVKTGVKSSVSATNVITDNPKLQVYTENGIIFYHNLKAGSPALNAGDDTLINLEKDQIGNVRKVGIVDIGAIEMQ